MDFLKLAYEHILKKIIIILNKILKKNEDIIKLTKSIAKK